MFLFYVSEKKITNIFSELQMLILKRLGGNQNRDLEMQDLGFPAAGDSPVTLHVNSGTELSNASHIIRIA